MSMPPKNRQQPDHDKSWIFIKEYSGEQKVTCTSVNAKFDVEVTSMCMVLTMISHQNFKEAITFYAILDNCSHGVS